MRIKQYIVSLIIFLLCFWTKTEVSAQVLVGDSAVIQRIRYADGYGGYGGPCYYLLSESTWNPIVKEFSVIYGRNDEPGMRWVWFAPKLPGFRSSTYSVKYKIEYQTTYCEPMQKYFSVSATGVKDSIVAIFGDDFANTTVFGIQMNYDSTKSDFAKSDRDFTINNNTSDTLECYQWSVVLDSTFPQINITATPDTLVLHPGEQKKTVSLHFTTKDIYEDSNFDAIALIQAKYRIGAIDTSFTQKLHLRFVPTNFTRTNESKNAEFAFSIYPNPSSSSVAISLTSAKRLPYSISIFDELGREVRRVHDGFLDAGEHEFSAELPTGMYYVRVQAGDEVLSRKVTVVR